MIADADAALYAAKNNGRNTIFCAQQISANESNLRGGLSLECVASKFSYADKQ
jgi:hypothetical protein